VEELARVLKVLLRTTVEEENKCQLIILNACHSDTTAYRLWKALHEFSVSIIGHTGDVPDQAAILFSRALYQSLGELNAIEDAFKAGGTAAADGVGSKSTRYVLYAGRFAGTFKLTKPQTKHEIHAEEEIQNYICAVAEVEKREADARADMYVTHVQQTHLNGYRFVEGHIMGGQLVCKWCIQPREEHHYAGPKDFEFF